MLRLLMYLGPLAGILGLYAAGRALAAVRSESAGDDTLRAIQSAIREGTTAFLSREVRVLVMSAAAVFVLLAIGVGLSTGFAFLFGAGCSMLAGYRGVIAASDSSARIGEAARDSGEDRALRIAFNGASVTGISAASVGLVGVGALYWFWGDPSGAAVINGFALGASSVAIVARVGGSLFASAAAVGNGVGGRLEPASSHDNLRNPGAICDCVADSVNGVAGMGADLFESYCGSIIATIAIAATMSKVSLLLLGDGLVEAETLQSQLMMYPLVMAVVGLFAAVGGICSLGWLEGRGSKAALRYATLIAGGLFLLVALMVTASCNISTGVWWAVTVGTVSAATMGLVSGPASSGCSMECSAQASQTGTAANLVRSLALGFQRCALPLVTICAAIFFANAVAGVYGIGIAAVGMVATVGVTMTLQAYGPIIDSAGGILRLAGLTPRACEVIGGVSATGKNLTAARGNGVAIGCAALTALSLFWAYAMAVDLEKVRGGHAVMQILVTDPKVLIGLFVGGTLPFFSAGLLTTAAGRVAAALVDEIRRQLRELPGFLGGRPDALPDAARCVDVATQTAMRQIMPVGLVVASAPVIVGLLLGPEALGGMLVGAILCGVLLAAVLASAAYHQDDAGKAIEKREIDGEQGGASVRRTAVVADIAGDSVKDTAGLSMNVFIKLMSVVSLVIAPLLA